MCCLHKTHIELGHLATKYSSKEVIFDVQLDDCKSMDGRFNIGFYHGLGAGVGVDPIRARCDDCNHMIEGPNFNSTYKTIKL